MNKRTKEFLENFYNPFSWILLIMAVGVIILLISIIAYGCSEEIPLEEYKDTITKIEIREEKYVGIWKEYDHTWLIHLENHAPIISIQRPPYKKGDKLTIQRTNKRCAVIVGLNSPI